jgi:hypothetical protein
MPDCSTASVLVLALLGARKPYFVLNQDVRLAALSGGSLIIIYYSRFVAPDLSICSVIFGELSVHEDALCGLFWTGNESLGSIKDGKFLD